VSPTAPVLLALAALFASSSCSGTTAPTAPARPGVTSTASAHAPAAAARPVRVREASWRLPGPVSREAAVVGADGRITIAGGLRPGDQTTGAFYTIDPATGRVGGRGRLGVPVHDTAGVAMPDGDWILGGGNSSEQRVVQRIHAGRAWMLGNLPGARSDLAAMVVAGRACALGGYDGSRTAVGEIDCSRDGRRWRRLTSLSVPVRYPGLARRGDTVLVFGGQRGLTMVDTVQEIDLRTGAARVIGHLPRPLGHEAAVTTPTGIWVLGGRTDANTVTARAWSYDATSGRFRRIKPLPYPLADAAVAVTPRATWLLGGETPAWTDRVLEIGAR